MQKADKAANDFVSSMKLLVSKPIAFIALILLSLIEPIVNLSLTFFAGCALCGNTMDTPTIIMLLNIMTLNMYASNAAAIIPTPGNGGALETTMAMTLSNFFKGTTGWVILLCRFFNFYIYIFVGFFMTIYDLIRQIKKERKLMKEAKIIQQQKQENPPLENTPSQKEDKQNK